MSVPDERRRLLLPASELAGVLAAVGVDPSTLPRGLLDDDATPADDARPHPSVAAGVALVAAGPRLVVRAGTAWRRRVTVLAVGGGLGASLARDEQAPASPGPVEQSLFPPHLLGEEVRRCLPPVAAAPRTGRSPVRELDVALLLAGLLPEDADRLPGDLVASLEVTAELPPAAGRPGVVDRLLWVSADGGWWQLVPGSDRHGTAAVDVVPVEPDDLPSAVAPLLAGLLAVAAGGRP